MRKPLFWIAVVCCLIAGGTWVRYRILANQDDADYKAQIRLARAEGLPTNAAEFAATIRPAPPAENAARFYRDLRPLIKPIGNFSDVEIAFLRDPSQQKLRSAQACLRRGENVLKLVDTATKLPRCWFDRNWSDGPAVLLPELADMKSAAKLLGLRGSIAANEGKESSALANAHQIFVIAKHAGEEGTSLSALVSLAIYVIGMNRIATWAVLDPSSRTYRDELVRALNSIPQPDLRRENRDQLMMILSLIDLSLTKSGRESLGLKEEELPTGPNLVSILLSQPKARVAIVKAERDYWAALELPPKERTSAISDAVMRRNMALLAFPIAARLYDQLSSGQDDNGRDEISTRYDVLKRYQIAYTAVLRSLSNGGVTRKITTSDLKSPNDGQPLTYSFDGKQMVITLAGPVTGTPWRLRIPPDAPKH